MRSFYRSNDIWISLCLRLRTSMEYFLSTDVCLFLILFFLCSSSFCDVRCLCVFSANGGTTNTRRHRRDGMSGHEDQLTGLDFLYFSRLCVLEGGLLSSSSRLPGTSQQFAFPREDEEEDRLQGEERSDEVHRNQSRDEAKNQKKKKMRESVSGTAPTPTTSASSSSGLGSIVGPSDELLVELFKHVYLDDEEEIEEQDDDEGDSS